MVQLTALQIIDGGGAFDNTGTTVYSEAVGLLDQCSRGCHLCDGLSDIFQAFERSIARSRPSQRQIEIPLEAFTSIISHALNATICPDSRLLCYNTHER